MTLLHTRNSFCSPRAPGRAHQILCSNVRHGSGASGQLAFQTGGSFGAAFLQVLLEIMSGVVIFECCLQGLSVYLFYLHCTETEDAPIRGGHYLKAFWLATLSF